MSVLTSLVGGDGDRCVLPHPGRHRRHAVLGFNLEGVVGVRQQVADGHGGVVETRGSRQKADVTPAGFTALGSTDAVTAAFANNGECDVPAPAAVLWPRPLQDNRGLVDGGDHISRG